MTRRRAAVLFGVVAAIHLAVGFAPFRLDPPWPRSNGAHLVDGGVTITGPAIARSPRPPSWLAAARDTGEFAVDLEIRAREPDQVGPARIVTIEEDYTHADLMIGQDEADLVVRARRPGTDASGDPPLRVSGVFGDRRWHRISVTTPEGGLDVAVDGVSSARVTLPANAFRQWDTRYRLFVGDAARGDRVWRGEIRKLEAGAAGTEEDYLAAGALDRPPRLWYVPDRLDDPIGLAGAGIARIAEIALLHFAGFVPVGPLAIAMARGRRRRLLAATLAVLALAAGIQVGKVFFDGRHPALIDLVVEGCGGLAGAVALARRWSLSRQAGSGPDKRDRFGGRRKRAGEAVEHGAGVVAPLPVRDQPDPAYRERLSIGVDVGERPVQ